LNWHEPDIFVNEAQIGAWENSFCGCYFCADVADDFVMRLGAHWVQTHGKSFILLEGLKLLSQLDWLTRLRDALLPESLAYGCGSVPRARLVHRLYAIFGSLAQYGINPHCKGSVHDTENIPLTEYFGIFRVRDSELAP
jgi:hypothetical protein